MPRVALRPASATRTASEAAGSTTCEFGFACVTLVTSGPGCCEKSCVCKDDIGIGVEDNQAACSAGVARGCCDQDPVPEACGNYRMTRE